MAMPLLSVLIIEPHPLMREALHTTLLEEPDLCVVSEATNNTEALELIARVHPDVILLAIGNPGQSDLAAIALWRRTVSAALVVALITDEVPGQAQMARQYGADVVMSKTLTRVELLNLLRSYKSRQFSQPI